MRVREGDVVGGLSGRRRGTTGRGSALTLIVTAVVVGALVIGVGVVYYDAQRRIVEKQAHDTLMAVGQLKVDEIVAWRAAALKTAEYFQVRTVGRTDVPVWAATEEPAATARVRQLLADNAKYRDIGRILAFDPVSGRMVTSDGSRGSEYDAAVARAALDATAPAFGEPYRSDDHLYLDLAAPVAYPDGTKVVMLFRLDLRSYLYPLLQKWPVPSRSAETLLARRDGDRVVFLNDVRFKPDSALTFAYPMAEQGVLAVKAVNGERGVTSGIDYRQQPVLGALFAIPGSDWVLVSKMDQVEAYAALQQTSMSAIAGVAFVLALLLAGYALAWRLRTVSVLRERAQSAERLAEITRNAGDPVILTDADLRITEVNERAIDVYGYGRDEFLTKRLADLRAATAGEVPADDAGLTARIEGSPRGLVFEETHARKDGSELPVEISASVSGSGPDGRYVWVVRDVSERRRMQAALIESEDKFRHVFEHSSVAKSITKPTGEVSVNDAFLAMLGYTREEFGAHVTWQELSHPGDVEETNRYVKALLAGEIATARFLKRYLRKDGAVIWADVSTTLRRSRSGEPDYFMTTIVDITERKRAEEQLAERERELAQLFDNMSQGFAVHEMIFDDDGTPSDYRFLSVNPAFEALTGLDAGSVVGRTVLEVMPGIERYWIERYGEVVKTGEPATLEQYAEALGRHYEVVAYAPAPGRFATIISDITERKAADEALRETTQYLENLITYSNVPMIVWDPMMRITRFNPAFERLTGRASADVVGRTLDLLFPEDSKQASLAQIERTLEGESWETVEIPILRADGEVRIALWNSARILDRDGVTLQAVIAQGQDITERKAAEHELLAYRQHLEALVEDRTQELTATNEELDSTNEELTSVNEELAATNEELTSVNEELAATNEELTSVNEELQAATMAKSEFLANMSHELRTPLNSIIGFAGVMLQGMTGALTSEQTSQLTMIRRSGERLLALISDMLDLSKIEAGRAFVQVSTFRLDDVIAAAVAMMTPIAAEHGLELVSPRDPVDVRLRTDEQKVHQVLVNLLANAVKFTDHGSVTLEVDASDAATVTLRVRDTGVGIAPEDLAEIFEEFVQIPRHGAKPEGTGLGLAISRRLALMLGGSLTAESVVGAGSTFTLVLPREYRNPEE